MASTVFVAGATGYTGREVTRLCAEGGHRTVAHVRPDSPSLEAWRGRFEAMGAEVDATAWADGPMAETLTRLQPDVVFALLGTTRARGRAAARRGAEASSQSYEAVDYGLTAMLLRAAVSAGSRPRFVYLSSLGTRAGVRNHYLAVRWKTEEAVRASGLPYTLARPSFISGPDRDDGRVGERVGASLAHAAMSALALLDGGHTQRKFGPHGNTDLAAGLIRCAFDPEFEGRVAEAADLREG